MNSVVSQYELGDRPVGIMLKIARAIALRRLQFITRGHLVINDPIGTSEFGTGELVARIDVTDLNFYSRLLTGGSLGAADAYIAGEWTTPSLTDVVRLFARHRDTLVTIEGGVAKARQWIAQCIHLFRRNSRNGSKRNIHAHYDLGNAFFSSFLDTEMMYSSALFSSSDQSLESASQDKLQRVIELLDIKDNQQILEIGTGWGGMAIAIAKAHNCHVTTITISQEQYEMARQRVISEGLQDRIDVQLCDYRDVTGTYDRIVSIEMIEAVGHQYLPTFFRTCARALKPGGTLLMQAITIEDHRYAGARDSVDFIKHYIFPGSFIPCPSVLIDHAAKHGKLRLNYANDFGMSYAKTCQIWRERFIANIEVIEKIGFNREFARLWEFYLAYCEAGFIEQAIGVSHLRWVKSALASQALE